MKKKYYITQVLIITIILHIISSCANIEINPKEFENIQFNHNWQFITDDASTESPDEFVQLNPLLKWKTVDIPHTPHLEPLVVNNQWQGICWYKKIIPYQENWENKKIYIRFEGAMNIAEVWINGTKKTTHFGGYLPFVVEISNDLSKDKENILYVRLNNEDSKITGPKPLAQLDFNMYGGIYRDVFLLVKNKIHISDEQYADNVAGGGVFVTFPEVNDQSSTINIKTNVVNGENENYTVTVKHILEDNNGKVVQTKNKTLIAAGGNVNIIQNLKVHDTKLWSPQHPFLYQLHTIIYKGKEVVDMKTEKIGIRKFEFIDNELYINGEKIFLRGVNRHQEYPYIGYALSNNANYRDAYKIKQAGFDYVRLSHYPHSKSFVEACDELGIVLIDAILGWQYYREYQPFKNHVLQTCRDMIRRDRNHPSILAWEVSLNESWMPESFIDSLTNAAHEEFPGEDCYTAGWQKYGFDVYLQARQHRIGHKPDYANKPYIVSEYGDWEYYAMNAGFNQDKWSDLLPELRSSRQPLNSGEQRLLQQARNLQEAHNDNFNTPAVADGYWDMFDYNRGYADDIEYSGIMSIFRLPKFSYYFYKSQRSPGEPILGNASGPMIFIASYLNQESANTVRIFSNCEEVELMYKDNVVAKQFPDSDQCSNNLKHPSFTFKLDTIPVGSLKVIGYINNVTVTESYVKSAGDPYGIKLSIDESGKKIEAGCNDIVFVYAAIVDQDGILCPREERNIKIITEGDIKIIGPDNISAQAGIASFLIQAGKKAGIALIKAESKDLESDKTEVEIF